MQQIKSVCGCFFNEMHLDCASFSVYVCRLVPLHFLPKGPVFQELIQAGGFLRLLRVGEVCCSQKEKKNKHCFINPGCMK